MPGRLSKPLCFLQFFVWPIVVVLCMGAAGIRLNLTSSVPIGLYRVVTEDAKATFVEFCPPGPLGVLSVVRGYREASERCRDHGKPLLKPIIAREGDVVENSAAGLSINGHLLPNTAAQARDSSGRPIPSWEFGRFRVAAGTVWVASSYNAKSFDSRYFGPVAVSEIRDGLRPLWTRE
jgi:conjugative transfer signal peptidase TraF